MRMIDADALKQIAQEYGFTFVDFQALDNAPTIDAVPVVRCGECKRRYKSADLTDTVFCPWLNMSMRKTDFCSYGERKDGAE